MLEEAGGPGVGPVGPVGFRTAGGWFHATRELEGRSEGDAYVATLATSDPLGRRIELRLEPQAGGEIAVRARVTGATVADVTATGIAFASRDGERYLGFGERSNAVDQRGREVEHYAAEGPFQTEERPFIPGFVPAWGYRPREDTTYFPMPWLLSTVGYGVLLDNSEESRHRLGIDDPGSWSVEVQATELRLRVFAGPRPADALQRLTSRLGRQPRPAAPFVWGPWYQPTGDDQQGVLGRLLGGDVPLSVAQTYTHYLPCASQAGKRDAERERVGRFHAAGLAVTTYFNPMICTQHPAYDEGARAGAFTRNAAGDPYVYRYSTATNFVVSQFDFTAPAGVDLYGRLLAEAVEDGHDGWMEDFGEYTPPDSRSANGMAGTEMHNLYPTTYHCGSRAFQVRSPRPVVPFARSGWNGSARCSQVVWGGDPTTDWGFDGLRSAVYNGLTMGLSGVSTWGSDIGGFFALGQRRLTPELLVRWIQLGAVSGVMRTQAEGIAIPDKPRPQIWDEAIVGHWRRWAKLRTQLYPYLVAADAAYQRTGVPIMRHHALANPLDPAAVARDDQFMFGPSLLAAPVLEPGATRRLLYLPRGRWVDLWRSVRYRVPTGGLRLRRARALRGGRGVELPAPLGELPLLARAGALLPMLTSDVDTLASYGRRAPAVSLGERRRRALLAFPRGRSGAQFDGGLLQSREGRRRWRLTFRSRASRRWRIQASLATLRRPFRPCSLRLRGRPLRRRAWKYERRTRALTVRLKVRSGTLVARGCRR